MALGSLDSLAADVAKAAGSKRQPSRRSGGTSGDLTVRGHRTRTPVVTRPYSPSEPVSPVQRGIRRELDFLAPLKTAIKQAYYNGVKPDYLSLRKTFGKQGAALAETAFIKHIAGEEDLKEPEDLTNAILLATGAGGALRLAGGLTARAVGGAVLKEGAETVESGVLKRFLAGAVKKAEPAAVATVRKGVAQAASRAPLPVKVAAKAAGKAAVYPIKHPFTSPLAIETPAALTHGGIGVHPGQFLAALEGKGTFAKAAGAISGGLSHVSPLLGEATNVAANALPSVFLTGKAGVNAVEGHPAQLNKLLEEWKKTGVLPALVEGGPSKALAAFGAHPIFGALEASGAVAAAGRTAGIAARALPGKVGAMENRPLIPIEGTPTKVDRGRYSPDLTRQYFPRYGQRARDKRVPSIAPNSLKGQHFLKEAINRETVGNRAVEVMRTRESLRALKDLLPRKGPTVRIGGHVYGKLDRATADIVGLAVERIVRDPSKFAEDLPAYKRMIEEAGRERDNLTGNLIMGPEELKRNKENVKILERGIKRASPEHVVDAANAFIELQKPLLQHMVEVGLITPERAAQASVIPHARIHMGASHGEPHALYKDLENQIQASRREFSGEARAHLGPPAPDGKPGGFVGAHKTAKDRLASAEAGYVQAERSLATARADLKLPKTEKGRPKAIQRVGRAKATVDAAKKRVGVAKAEVRQTGAVLQTEARRLGKEGKRKLGPLEAQLKQAKKNGPRLVDEHGYPLTYEQVHAHMAKSGIEPPGFLSQTPPVAGDYFQPNLGGASLGKGTRTGATALGGTHLFYIEGLARTIRKAVGFTARMEAWNHIISKYGTVLLHAKTWAEGKKAIAHPEAYGLDPRVKWRAVPRYPLHAKKAEMEGALEHQDPTTGGDIVSGVVYDALKEARAETPNASLDPQTEIAFIPDIQAKQLMADAAPSGLGLKGTQAATTVFKRAVLPFSPNFYIGNGVDNAIRTVLAGINPAHLVFGKAAERALSPEDKAKLAQGAFFSSVDVVAPHRSVANVVTADNRLAQSLRDAAEWSQKHGAKQAALKFGPKALSDLSHYFLTTNAYVTEVLPQRGVIGKLAIAEWQATGHSLVSAVKDVQAVADNFAKGVASDPARLIAAQKGIERVLGNYSRMSPAARKVLSNVMPFWTWTRAAYTYVYLTMPIHHPVQTSFIAAASNATRLERESYGLDKQGDRPLPNFLQGGIPDSGDRSVWPTASINSFGFAGGPLSGVTGGIGAQVRTALQAVEGVSGWKQSVIPGSEQDHLIAAGAAVLGGIFPGFNALVEEKNGKKAFNPHLSLPHPYDHGYLEYLREPKQTITVPATGSGGGSSGAGGVDYGKVFSGGSGSGVDYAKVFGGG